MKKRLEVLKDHFKDRWNSLQGNRANWVSVWKDIAEHFLPDAAIVDDDPKSHAESAGTRDNDLIDGTGVMALDMLASGMQSGLTSPTNKWFEFTSGDQNIDRLHHVREWFWDVEHKMLMAYAKSNFYSSTYNMHLELGSLGTSAMVILPDPDTIINCISYTPGTYYLGSNYRGYIDTIYRRFPMTARQMVDEFGYEVCSTAVQDCYDRNDTEKYFNVLHAIEPNPSIRYGYVDNTNYPFISAYYESDSDEHLFLRVSGFEEQSFFSPRWSVTCNNVYGTSPARKALGHAKMLQSMQKDLIRGVAKQVNPPMVASGDVKKGAMNVMPKGVTFVDTTRNGKFEPAFQVNFDLQSLEAKIVNTQEELKRYFYNDLFMMQAMTSKRQTAYETEVKEGEKMRMLSPVVERMQYEYLDLVVNRVFGIMYRAGHFSEPPMELQGRELNVNYLGLLSRAQKMIGAENIGRWLGFVGNFAGIKPEVIDIADIDFACREYGNVIGVNPKVMKKEDVVDNIRENRAKMMQQEQERAHQMQDVQAAELMSNTEVKPDSVLSKISQGI